MMNSALVSRVEKTIRLQRLFRPGGALVVGLSGGADSIALLDILSRLQGYNLHLIATHLNHCLRGAESDADQEFCRLLAGQYAIPFEVRRIDIKKMAEDQRLNLEDAGRRARIAFFDEIRAKYGAAAVALAHHADDQAETLLMRLLRGSGMTGLSGMAYRNDRGYIRPLLDITRVEIEQYLRSYGIEWREDASNSDTVYLRNRIRHQLLPLLEEYNPAIRAGLAATASIIRGDEVLLRELTEQTFAASCRIRDNSVEGSVVQLRALNPALRRRVLRYAFSRSAGSLERVTQRHIDALFEMIDSSRPNSRLAFPHGVTVLREYDRLVWVKGDDSSLESGFEMHISEPGCYQLPGGASIEVEVARSTTFKASSDAVYVDLNKFPFPWLVRTFRSGDRMQPFGMKGRKKVKDIFIDHKIPQSERRSIPLLYCGNDLVWVAGVCASELSRVCEDTYAVVKATCKRQ